MSCVSLQRTEMASQRLSPVSSPLLRLLFKKGVLNVHLRLPHREPVGPIRRGPTSRSLCPLRFRNICGRTRPNPQPKWRSRSRGLSLCAIFFSLLHVACQGSGQSPAVSRGGEEGNPVLCRLSPPHTHLVHRRLQTNQPPPNTTTTTSLQPSACSPPDILSPVQTGDPRPPLKT